MHSDILQIPDRETLVRHVIHSLDRYWPQNDDRMDSLPVHHQPIQPIKMPLTLIRISLPKWAEHCGVDKKIAVPVEACGLSPRPGWLNVDWWLAAFLLLECWHERIQETMTGTIHSYSIRLKGWDENVWKYAWVNRIALFLRAWCAKLSKDEEEKIFGAVAKAQIILTHDVDAVAKTWPIRLKKGGFSLFQICEAIRKGRLTRARSILNQTMKFMLDQNDWWNLDTLIEKEKLCGVRSQFNFFADIRSKNLKRWLFDPGYVASSFQIKCFIRKIHKDGWSVGLHPSFDSWADTGLIKIQKKNLEKGLPFKVKSCRQHWLRFSFKKTWMAQQTAGISQDTTLMFNDRPGFRASAALQWKPWDEKTSKPHALFALPTIFMDSHFYDYKQLQVKERKKNMLHWIDEVKKVGGQAAVLWHPHTLTDDYGWQSGFDDLLEVIPLSHSFGY